MLSVLEEFVLVDMRALRNSSSSLPNQVVTIVDTNYAPIGKPSSVKYNHFSLLKTLEAGFGLPYLNHAADKNVKLMSDLFSY